MTHSPSFLNRLERRFGHLAIAGLLRGMAGLQLICFILLQVNPGFIDKLALTPQAWENFEIWRFFTFCFIPSTRSLLWIVFALIILLRIGDQLEAEWGKFRLNLYVASTVVCLWAAVLLGGPIWGMVPGLYAGTVLYSSLFIAFATVAPRYEFLLFFILPVQVRWLALLDIAGLLTMLFIQLPEVVPLHARLLPLLGLVPYAVYAGPILRHWRQHSSRVAARRATFRENSLPVTEIFHECHVCRRTDQSDPGLEFRVAADGEEYCADHLPAVNR